METSFNPWRGLSSYEDPEKIERQYLFMGREVETDALVRLIDNNLFVTLYGRAGVGKTSLLRAGVFPVLRKRGYFPLYIRLALESDHIDYAKTIVDKIEEAASESNFNVTHNKALPTNSDAKSFLWEYFAAASFADHDGNVIYPVIVLDQFEEIFLADTDKAHNLLLQIHAMLNDDYEASEEQNSATNYRFVASIREDMLFHLEDCIDENHLALLKNNRYRLRPLSDEKAKEAVLGPGAGFLMKGEENVIAERIIEASREKDGTISSLILSLLCSQLYVRAEREMEKNRQKNDDENEQYSSDVLLAHNEMYAHKQKPYSKPIISINQIPVTDEGTDNILTEFFKANTDSKQRRIIEK
ncbi:MAG: ATP-binding protein, partial [Muribaculaceae bacterium]|nr:ATP-binding protein [Muribaculaceae bacterium]